MDITAVTEQIQLGVVATVAILGVLIAAYGTILALRMVYRSLRYELLYYEGDHGYGTWKGHIYRDRMTGKSLKKDMGRW